MSNSRQSRSFLRSVERDEKGRERMLKGKRRKGMKLVTKFTARYRKQKVMMTVSLSVLFASFFPSEGKQTLWLDRKLVLIFFFLPSLVFWHPPFATSRERERAQFWCTFRSSRTGQNLHSRILVQTLTGLFSLHY